VSEPLPIASTSGEFFLQVHVTSQCNLACRHCYVDSAPGEMTQRLFREVLEHFRDLASAVNTPSMWIQVTGGEPLLHSQIWELLEETATYYPVRLLTNGTLIDAARAQRLSSLVQSVQISFDGLQPTHDTWRGHGAYDAAFTGLMHLKAAGVPCTARMTVGKENQDDVEEVSALLSPHVDAFHVSRIVPVGSNDLALPDTSRYRQIIYRLYGLQRDSLTPGLRDPFFGVLLKAHDPDTCYTGCSAGTGGICVTEAGDILPCRRLPITLGNVSDMTLIEAYASHPLMQALRARRLKGTCADCEDRAVCGGSRCIAYALTGDPLGPDPGCVFA
jgi:radical SAM protein with 4Fe4S-binding SPASM domain